MSPRLGSAFWLHLASTPKPLIGRANLSLFVCPRSKARPQAGFTNYRGPTKDVATLRPHEPVGACEPGSHPTGTITVLYNSGDVLSLHPSDPRYKMAIAGTRGGGAPPPKPEVLPEPRKDTPTNLVHLKDAPAKVDLLGDPLPKGAVARLGTARLLVPDGANTLSFSPDGTHVVLSGGDGTVRLWESATGREVHRLMGHAGPVTSAQYSPDGKTIVSASVDRTLRVWDAATGQEKKALKGHAGPVMALALSSDGKRAATGGADRTARIWDLAAGKELSKFDGHQGIVRDVALSADGKVMAVGVPPKYVNLWDTTSGELLHKLEGPRVSVQSVAMSPDGKTVATGGSWDPTIRLWDTQTGRMMRALAFKGLSGPVSTLTLSFSPDGTHVASGDSQSMIRVWKTETGEEVWKTKGPGTFVTALAYHPDGKQVATVGSDQMLRFWDARTGKASGGVEAHAGGIRSVDVSRDGTLMATGGGDGHVRLWDGTTGTFRASFETAAGVHLDAAHVALSPDGKHLVAGRSAHVQAWEIGTKKELWRYGSMRGVVRALRYTPDGKRVMALGAHGMLHVLDVETGKAVDGMKSDGAEAFVFSPDGATLALGCRDGQVRLVALGARRLSRGFGGRPKPFYAIAFSPDGKLVATGSQDKTVRLWDTATGKPVRVMTGHTGVVAALDFSPDGTLLATGGSEDFKNRNQAEVKEIAKRGPDRSVRIWDVKTGRELLKLEGHERVITSLSFTPDGKRIVTGSHDSTALVWSLEPFVTLLK